MTGTFFGDPSEDRELPPLVQRAHELAEQMQFEDSCRVSVGFLLRTLASTASQPILEIGTGVGVGTAWLADGAHPKVPIVSVEIDELRAMSSADLFAEHPNVEVVNGTFTDVASRGPFSLAFVDISELKDDGTPVVEAMASGGTIVLDDFTPLWLKDSSWQSTPDDRREFWLTHPDLVTTEILTTSRTSAILSVKKA